MTERFPVQWYRDRTDGDGAKVRPDRAIVEQRALEAVVQYPQLAGEFGAEPDCWREPVARRVADAAFATETFDDDGSVPLGDVLARAGLDPACAWVRSTFATLFPGPEPARHWVRLLADLELRQRVHEAFAAAFEETAGGTELLGSVAQLVGRFEARNHTGVQDMRTVGLRFLSDRMQALAEGRGPVGVSTGFPLLDRSLKGWRPTELTVLVAGPGVGKTTLAEHWRGHLARRGFYSLLFSGEMSEEQTAERLVHAETMTPLSDALTDLRRLSDAEPRMRNSDALGRMLIDARPDLSPARLTTVARAELRKRGVLALVVIDHLRHIVATPSPREYDQVSAAAAAAKRLAKDVPAPVLLLTHLSRARGDMGAREFRPTLEMIRGSGRIEDEADNVLAIWRPEGSSATYLAVLKGRQSGGYLPRLELSYNRHAQSYAEVGEAPR